VFNGTALSIIETKLLPSGPLSSGVGAPWLGLVIGVPKFGIG